jgi:glycosyltransferase involved in cell wall biosynthesis
MNPLPEVSLLIPTYNNAETVRAAIRSCVQQTYTDLEILIYDEVSQDGTRDIIHAAAKEDSRIRVLTGDTNSGPVRAWHRLLKEARGRYCTFVWSDDMLLPRYVETLKAVLDANPRQLLAGCGAYGESMPPPGAADPCAAQPDRQQGYPYPDIRLKGDEYALGILTGVFPLTQICSLFLTESAREVFEHYIQIENPYGFDFTRRAYGNDVSFLSELALRSGEVLLTGEPLVVLRTSPRSMTIVAMASHRFDFWLQYVWATTQAWQRCRPLSPRMDILIRVATDRLHLIDTLAALAGRRWPRYGNPWRILRALLFLVRHDHRLNRQVTPEHLIRWLARQTA